MKRKHAESRICEIVADFDGKFEQSPDESERAIICKELILYLDKQVSTGVKINQVRSYYLACSWLSRSELIWKWILERAKNANELECQILVDSVFDLLVEDPPDVFWNTKFLSECLSEKKLWKYVAMAYEERPQKLIDDLKVLA